MTPLRCGRQTSLRRVAVVLLPCSGIVVALLAGIAEGAIPVSLAVSSGGFKISADQFSGSNFQLFGSTVEEKDGSTEPVGLVALGHATLSNLCQSVAMTLPLIDKKIVLKITGGDQGTPVSATDMIVSASGQRGDGEFKNVVIGADASTMTQYPALKGTPGAFGLEADSISVSHLQEDQYAVTAGTFTVPHLNLSVSTGNVECY